MTSEIRTNTLTSRAGLSTVTLTDSGPMFSGITTFVDNSGFNIGTGSSIFSPAANTLTFGTNSNERIRINSSGNVGLGVNNPTRKLDVSGDVLGNAFMLRGNTSASPSIQAQMFRPENDTLAFATNGNNERLRITSAGEVLIGGRTAKPNDINKLVVTGTSPADAYDSQLYLEGSETSGAVDTGGALAFGGHDGSSHRNWANIYGMKENGTGGNQDAYLSFHTRANGGNPTEKLRITSGGELLVGTQNKINTSPTKFQIASNDATGSAILARFNANSYSSYLDFYKSRSNTLGTAYVVNSNDHLGALRFYAADGSNSGYTTAAEIYGSCDGGSGASGDMPGRITFHTRPDGAGQSMQERLRITSDGKVVAGGSGAGYPSRLQSHGAGNLLDLNSTSGAAVIRFYESGSGRFDLRTNNGSSGLNFYDSLNGVERIRINQHGGLRVFAAASDPTGIQAGEIYYNTTTNRLRVYNGSRWLNPDENKDPYASSVVCLFNGDSYTDLTGRHTLTQVGAGGLSNNYMSPVGSTSTYRIAHSNSTGNYMNITGNLGDFRLDDGNWTMEFWVRTTGTNGYHHYFVADGQGSKGTFKGYTNNGSVTEMAYFYSSNGTGVIYNPGGSPFAYNDWQHYAWDRTGSTTRFYLDGVVRASSTASYPGGNPTLCHIGKWNNEAIEFYIDNFRFTRGVARYGGNGFEVPRTKYSSG